MTERYKNNARSYLQTPVSAANTQLVLVAGGAAAFPTLATGDTFSATLVSASGSLEIVTVTAVAGDALTVVRGAEDTVPQAFTAGSLVELRITVGALQALTDTINVRSAYGFARPGDASELFEFGDATTAQNIYGNVVRFTQAGKLTTKGPIAIEDGSVYTCRFQYSRSLDSGDPANDGLQFGIDLLNGFGNLLEERTLAVDNSLLVQSQERKVEVKIASSTLPSATVILPYNAKYVRPWVKVYGIGHQTDIEVCGVLIDPPPGATGIPGPNAQITVSGAPSVARTFYVTMTGNDTNDGTTLYAPLATVNAALVKATTLALPCIIVVHPGEYTVQANTVIPRNCTLYGYDLRSTKLSLPAGQEENIMFLMNSGIKVRGFTFSGLRHEAGWTFTTPPQKGFAFAFNPGETITRSPYISDCSQLHNFTQDQLTLPIDKAAGNPLMPRGGGNLLADGSVLSPSSPLRSVVIDSFTAINPNGVGYLIRRNAFVQLVSVFTNWSRVGLWSQQGGQVTVANSNNTFGDYALAATGFRNIVNLPDRSPTAPIGVFQPAADQITLDQAVIINNMYAQLASEFVEVQAFTTEQENFTRRDAATLLREISDDLRSGQDSGIRFFIQGLFDWNAQYHFASSLLPIFLRSFEILLAQIKLRPPQVILPAEDMLDYLFGFLATNLAAPPRTGYASVIEANAQQFSYAGTGVNYNSLPTSQRGTGQAVDPRQAIYKTDGGRIYATFSTEVGDTYLGEDLRVDFERNTIEGQAFSRGVQNIALPLIIGVGG